MYAVWYIKCTPCGEGGGAKKCGSRCACVSRLVSSAGSSDHTRPRRDATHRAARVRALHRTHNIDSKKSRPRPPSCARRRAACASPRAAARCTASGGATPRRGRPRGTRPPQGRGRGPAAAAAARTLRRAAVRRTRACGGAACAGAGAARAGRRLMACLTIWDGWASRASAPWHGRGFG